VQHGVQITCWCRLTVHQYESTGTRCDSPGSSVLHTTTSLTNHELALHHPLTHPAR
jgi:hypothetical protein